MILFITMETTSSLKPKTMAELLPGLTGILSKETMQALTAKKQPRQAIALTRTAERVMKPLTIAEMRASMLALKVQTPRRNTQAATTSKKKNWNSSMKIDKTVSHTANGQMKYNPVRKALQFQPKPKAVTNRATMVPDTPVFTKPEVKAKKTLQLQARNNVRISGICNISETPVVNKPSNGRMTVANKENIANQLSIKKLPVPPKPMYIHKKLIPPVPNTPLLNESWKSSCDASFLQKEKEINDIEEKIKATSETHTIQTLENIAEVTPPASTPFREYRSIQEYFNNSSLENTAAYHDSTIMCFEKPSDCKENNNRQESVIVSLCDLLNKASVTNSEKISTELEDLLKIETQAEHKLKMIDNSISALNKIKEAELTTLQYVRKLIKEKKANCERADKTLIKETPKAMKMEKVSPLRELTVSKPCSVIKSNAKSPSYKIPKKNLCLRKKVFCKSMPNVSNEMITPVKADMGSRALSMYMKMKENMKFLNTPVAKRRLDVTDTPAVTSHNLQKQLDKLYEEN